MNFQCTLFRWFWKIHCQLIPSLSIDTNGSIYKDHALHFQYYEKLLSRKMIVNVEFLESVLIGIQFCIYNCILHCFCVVGRFQRSEGIESLFSFFPGTHQCSKQNYDHFTNMKKVNSNLIYFTAVVLTYWIVFWSTKITAYHERHFTARKKVLLVELIISIISFVGWWHSSPSFLTPLLGWNAAQIWTNLQNDM